MSAHIESMEQEVELLAQAPPEGRGAGPKKDDEDDTWRLDKKTRSLLDQGGPLLDASGRVHRLPSSLVLISVTYVLTAASTLHYTTCRW